MSRPSFSIGFERGFRRSIFGGLHGDVKVRSHRRRSIVPYLYRRLDNATSMMFSVTSSATGNTVFGELRCVIKMILFGRGRRRPFKSLLVPKLGVDFLGWQ
jgi:hypothetical protein